MARLAGRVALVTGTSPNIGGGIVEALASAGAAIVAVDALEANALDCAADVRRRGGRALGLTCDVTDPEQVEHSVAAARSEFGGVDILVNGAARIAKAGLLQMDLAEWRRQLSIILDGTFLFTQAVSRAMIERGTGGSIVNIISTAGHQGQPGNIAYCTAKMGLMNFTGSAAMELAPHGIRVNSLTPTATDPQEGAERARRWGREIQATPSAVLEQCRERIPTGRLPSPLDYGRSVVFLASADAEMITGTDLRVDAGAVAKYWAWQPGDPA